MRKRLWSDIGYWTVTLICFAAIGAMLGLGSW